MNLEAAGKVRWEPEICLNQLYRGVECRTCVERCPAGALSLTEGGLRFDPEACEECGVCLANCPTGVFRLEGWDERGLVQRVRESEAGRAVLFCGRHPAPYRKEAGEACDCFQVPVCLGGLTKAALFEIASEKKLELMVDACAGCGKKDCAEFIRQQAKQVCEMLCACQNAGNLFLTEKRPDGEKGRKRKAVPSGEQVCSRRQIIFRLAEAGRRTLTGERPASGGSGVPRVPVPNGVRTGRRLSYHPEWTERLRRSYRQAYESAAEHGEPAAWPAIRIRKNCTNCNMCASFCPTWALRIEVEEGESPEQMTAAHYFQPMLCADCRLCEAACPIEAIVRDRLPAERPFVTQIICRGPVTACEKCGALTYNVSGGRCYWCSSEASLEDIKAAVRRKLGKKT